MASETAITDPRNGPELNPDAPPQKRSRTKNYLAGLATGYVVTVATTLLGLFLTPYTLRFLDQEEYAIFTICNDVLVWLGLLDIGITAGLNVHVARQTGKPDQAMLNRLASTAFFSQLMIVVAVLAVGAGMAVGFPGFFNVKPEHHTQASLVMGLMAVNFAMTLGTRVYSSLLIAHQQVYIDNTIKLALVGLRASLTVLLLMAGWKMLSLVFAQMAATLITSTFAVIRVFRLLPNLKIKRSLVSWKDFRRISHVGIWFSLGSLGGLVVNALDQVLTAKFLAVALVTVLALTERLYTLAATILSQITDTARPMLGQLFGEGKKESALATYRYLFALSTGLSIIAAAAIWAGNQPFIGWWVGSHRYGGKWLDLALAVVMVVRAWVPPNRATLSANLIVRSQTICRLIEGALVLILAFILAPRLGVVGIVLATGIAGIISTCWYLPLLTSRMFERSFSETVRRDWCPMFALTASVAPVAFFSRYLADHLGGFWGAAIGMAITGSVGLGLFWLLGLDGAMRQRATQTAFRRKAPPSTRAAAAK